jgi:hypothetical protein
MGTRIDVIHTRHLTLDDASAVCKLGYKALHETGLFGVDYNEQHFYTHIRRGLVSPFWQGSIGLFHNDEIIGFAFLNINQLPWAPNREVATLQYYYIIPSYNNNQTTIKLFNAVDDYCQSKKLAALRISNKNVKDDSLLNLGFNTEERIYIKEYDLQD